MLIFDIENVQGVHLAERASEGIEEFTWLRGRGIMLRSFVVETRY